jgi:hypothetical protein
VIVEPLVQGASGMKMYSPVYLEKLQEACEDFEVHTIYDEVAVGFSGFHRGDHFFLSATFIITAASDDSMEEGKLTKNAESEVVGVIEEEEERPAEIEDEFASNDNVAEETVQETPMETEDTPRRVEEISETAIQEESMAETNIPEEMNTEDPPKEEVENKPVSNIPDEISNKEETSSVQEQEPSKPDDNSSEVFQREEQPETTTESPAPPPYSSSILKSVVSTTDFSMDDE